MSYGGPGGPLCSEVKSALYGVKNAPADDLDFVGGLGGRDMTPAAV
ncbi:MAG: hypothetical protein MZU91_06620 [Desulfosudis oleivorans]|nr:hypothetical protein [Desulfosudis oleivorans]